MDRIRTSLVLAIACLAAGAGPFLVADPSARQLAAAAAFSIPAVTPFFFGGRESGVAAGVVALALVAFASVVGAGALGDIVIRRELLARNLQMASAGALCGGLFAGAVWARAIAARSRSAD